MPISIIKTSSPKAAPLPYRTTYVPPYRCLVMYYVSKFVRENGRRIAVKLQVACIFGVQ